MTIAMMMMMMIMTVDGVRALNWILAEVGWLVKGLNCDLLPWDGREVHRAVQASAKKSSARKLAMLLSTGMIWWLRVINACKVLSCNEPFHNNTQSSIVSVLWLTDLVVPSQSKGAV